jgi:hypothetical protein
VASDRSGVSSQSVESETSNASSLAIMRVRNLLVADVLATAGCFLGLKVGRYVQEVATRVKSF